MSTANEIAALMLAELSGPALTAPRALLVSLDGAGALQHQPIGMGQSLVRIETELIDHLNARPLSDAWLESLRDYVDGRLAALDEARRTGGFAIPRGHQRWVIAHETAFQPVTVGGVQ